MGKRWKSTADLAEAMRERAARGRTVMLSPETALLVARTTFEYLCEKYPKESFSQRRRSWVEADRIIKRET